MANASSSSARLFTLVRTEDVSGTSGTGIVAEGVEFSDGSVVLHWISQYKSHELLDSIRVVELIHGHEGRTKVVYV